MAISIRKTLSILRLRNPNLHTLLPPSLAPEYFAETEVGCLTLVLAIGTVTSDSWFWFWFWVILVNEGDVVIQRLPLEVLQPARRGLGAGGLVVEDGVAVGGLAAAVPEDGALQHRQPRHIVHHHVNQSHQTPTQT